MSLIYHLYITYIWKGSAVLLPYFHPTFAVFLPCSQRSVKVRQKYGGKATKVGRKEAAYIRGIFFLPPALGLLHAFIKIWMWNVALRVSTFSFLGNSKSGSVFNQSSFYPDQLIFTENKTISF